MSIPLSQLMKSDHPDVGPPTETHDLCLSAKLFSELQAATERYTTLEGRLAVARDDADDEDRPRGPKRRLGQKSDFRELEAETEEAAAAADEIRHRMEATSTQLHLRVNEDAWADFTRANPPRDPAENAAGARLDRLYTGMLCDVDALITDGLPDFIARYGDEAPTGEMWEFVRTKSARGDRYLAASKVVQLHTKGIDLGKSRTALRSSQRTATASE